MRLSSKSVAVHRQPRAKFAQFSQILRVGGQIRCSDRYGFWNRHGSELVQRVGSITESEVFEERSDDILEKSLRGVEIDFGKCFPGIAVHDNGRSARTMPSAARWDFSLRQPAQPLDECALSLSRAACHSDIQCGPGEPGRQKCKFALLFADFP